MSRPKTHADFPAWEGLRFSYPATYEALKRSTLRRAPNFEILAEQKSRTELRSRGRKHRHRSSQKGDRESKSGSLAGSRSASAPSLPEIEIERPMPKMEFWCHSCPNMDKPKPTTLLLEDALAAQASLTPKPLPRAISKNGFRRNPAGSYFSFSIGGATVG
eukprot:TRINITY_DN108825_c0_g1_i1.p1 TRINITY_DN108825_c0_g1~~TRINITY_DN108825_c0_g1_i1.p1  ORF type:complete len:161 (-),score=23.77 TRINITY_DN108825_c0_g1_i1:146-628(-)